MSYRFFSLKFYIIGLVVLILIFLFSWLPKMRIDLFVYSEPLVVDFEIGLDVLAKNTLFNLNTLSTKVINEQEKENWPDYQFIDDLRDEKIGEVMIFKKSDLQELITYKTEKLLNEDGKNLINNYSNEAIGIKKKVLKFHPEKWEIELIKKDLLSGKGKINVFIQEEVIRDYNLEELKQKIKFKNINSIKKELESIYSIKKIEIEHRPWFWKQAPLFPNRIVFSIIPLNVSLGVDPSPFMD